jgi:hypothetical protein
MKRLLALVRAIVALSFVSVGQAAEVKISFLRDEGVLNDTVALLKKKGCLASSVHAFETAVRQFNAAGPSVDLTLFPEPRGGFYDFNQPDQLVRALKHCPCETAHEPTLNCFDTMILLTSGRLKAESKPDDLKLPYFFAMPMTNGDSILTVAATARDMFDQKYPSWYRAVTESTMANCAAADRMVMTAILFCDYMLPISTTQNTVEANVGATLQNQWRRHGLRFPKNCEVVLCYEVSVPRHYFSTAHCGVLFRHGNGFTYLEKAGMTGPFVRIDVREKKDLLPWLGAMFMWSKDDFTHSFTTFNDSGGVQNKTEIYPKWRK